MTEGAWQAIAFTSGGVLTLIGVWLTVRQGRKATDQAREADERSAQDETWDRQVGRLQAELDRVWPRLAALEEQHQEDRERIEALERDVAEGKRRYRAAIRYIHELLAWIKVHLPTHQPPRPPRDLLQEFDH